MSNNLQLLFLGETFGGLASWTLTNKTHGLDLGFVSPQHVSDLLHTVSVLWENHDPCGLLILFFTTSYLTKNIKTIIHHWSEILHLDSFFQKKSKNNYMNETFTEI